MRKISSLLTLLFDFETGPNIILAGTCFTSRSQKSTLLCLLNDGIKVMSLADLAIIRASSNFISLYQCELLIPLLSFETGPYVLCSQPRLALNSLSFCLHFPSAEIIDIITMPGLL